jgi:hypothetical protein
MRNTLFKIVIFLRDYMTSCHLKPNESGIQAPAEFGIGGEATGAKVAVASGAGVGEEDIELLDATASAPAAAAEEGVGLCGMLPPPCSEGVLLDGFDFFKYSLSSNIFLSPPPGLYLTF